MTRIGSQQSAVIALLLILVGLVPGGSKRQSRLPGSSWFALSPGPPTDPGRVETGTHWAGPSDFPSLQRLGYNFVVTNLHPSDRSNWAKTFDAAAAAGLRLIVGLYPPPYKFRDGEWIISDEGQAFLRYAASRPSVVKAIFVFNEPYWVHPLTKSNDRCGALSAAELRQLRTTIRAVWPEARIFHDIGRPSEWAPGGYLYRHYSCIGDKYKDPAGFADLVGIWFYPFKLDGYHRSEALSILEHEIAYVRNTMQAEPIVLGQSFKCARCGEGKGWPTPAELRDWNCTVRSLGPNAISWYPWRQSIYEDYLFNHPEIWNLTSSAACPG